MARPKTFYLISNNKVAGYASGTNDLDDNESTINSVKRWVRDGDNQSPPEVRSFIQTDEPPVTVKGPEVLKLEAGRVVLKTESELAEEKRLEDERKEAVQDVVKNLTASVKSKLMSASPLTEDEADFLLQIKPREWFRESGIKS